MGKYDHLQRDELLDLISQKEKELAEKKYGLVWDSEREPEEVVLKCKENLSVLERVKGKAVKSRTDTSIDHILIEGDNYHALTVLSYTHAGKVDVIYIDPPYNTGNKSWKYNNRYVETDDAYWHSKWLNMMEKRLGLAKRLLKQDGVLVCAIDENELANLLLLLRKIFPGHKIDHLVIISNPRGVQGKNFSYIHEYAIFVYPDDGQEYIGGIPRANPLVEELRDHGGSSRRTDARNCFYPFIVRNNQIIDIGDVPETTFHPKSKNTHKGKLTYIWPVDSGGVERKWVFARDTVETILKKLSVKVRHDGLLDITRTKDEQRPRTVWRNKNYDASTWGSKIVRQITGKDFPYPKSIHTVRDCINILVKSRPNAIVLDFFAGSGTTGQAVLEINKVDNGHRQFILCTNNEGDICTDITYPRIQRVITGYETKGKQRELLFEHDITWSDFKDPSQVLSHVEGVMAKKGYENMQITVEDGILSILGEKNKRGMRAGLGGNLQYFKTAFVKKSASRDQTKVDLTHACTGMLCVKEGIYNIAVQESDYKIFSSHSNNSFLCVYYNLIDDSFSDFLSELKKLKGKKIVYMFSLDGTVDQRLFKGIKDVSIEEIPQEILDIYTQLEKKNIPISPNLIFNELEKAKKKIFDDGDKDEGARSVRVAFEKVLQRIAQLRNVTVFGKQKTQQLIEDLKKASVLTRADAKECETVLGVGNSAAHGEYDQYDLSQVKKCYRTVQDLIDRFSIQ